MCETTTVTRPKTWPRTVSGPRGRGWDEDLTSLVVIQVKLVGLESFGDHVLQFFCDAIERQYPLHHLSPDTTPYEQGRIVKIAYTSDLFID